MRHRLWLAALLALVSPVWAQPLPPPGGAGSSAVQLGLHPGYVVGNCYVPLWQHNLAGAGWVSPTAGRIVCAYGGIAQTITISNLGASLQTSAAGNAQWAIYNNGAWGRPSTLVVATPSVSTSGTLAQTGAITQQLAAGNYWWCQNVDNATAVMYSYAALTALMTATVGSAAVNSVINTGASTAGIFIAQTFGTWPNFNSGAAWSSVTTASVPVMVFRVASVP